MSVLKAEVLDRALGNLSDMTTVEAEHEYGYSGNATALGFYLHSQEVSDLVAFFLHLMTEDELMAWEMQQCMTTDRPSYRGDWYVFPGVTLEGTSKYEGYEQ